MRIGIDVGGTKIEGILVDAAGHEHGRMRVPTPKGDYQGTVAAVVSLVRELDHRAGCRPTIGIGLPGTVSRSSGLIKNANSTWLNGRPLDRDLARAIGRPLRLANDANCFAISEAIDGAGAGAGVVFGVILGTGVGGGIVVGGQVLSGTNGIAGEWGHNPLPWAQGDDERPGPSCYCGRQGCIETFLSGPGFAARYAETAGLALEPEAIATLAEAGEPHAVAALDRYADRLSRALAHVINILDPDVIVLGGGLSKIAALYRTVPARWGRWVFSDTVETRLIPNRHGDSGGVRGAAWLWPPWDGGGYG
jgi:fructokinase